MTDFASPGDFSDLTIQFHEEPDISIDVPTGERLIFKSSGLNYTRDKFPQDNYRTAAKKIATQFFVWRATLGMMPNKEISFYVNPFKENSSKTITFGPKGITHNYDNVDTWHHWFMECLTEEIVSRWPK